MLATPEIPTFLDRRELLRRRQLWHAAASVILGLGFCHLNDVILAEEDAKTVSRFRVARGSALIVPARVLGDTRLFVVDTGAGFCVLDSRFDSRLTRAGKIKTRTAAGAVVLPTYDQPELAIGSVQVPSGGQVILFDMTPIREAAGRHLDGIVGVSVLRNYVLRFIPDDERLEILTSLPADSGTEIPVTWRKAGTMELELVCSGSHREKCLVDTGSMSRVTLRADLFDFLHDVGSITRLREIARVTANGTVQVQEGILDRIRLGDWEHSNVVVSRGTTFSIVGLKYLNRYTVTFDFPGRRLFLKPGKYFAEKSRRTCLGVGGYWRDEKLRLKYVIPDSPAAQAGLQPDDIIESVNGQPVDGSSLLKLRRLFENDGETVSLSLRRGDRVASVKIKLVDF
jgi:predicted aspartyl protease